MNLALGNECVVYDYGANKPVSRALFQGIEWIRFVLNKRWLDKTIIPFVRGHNVEKYFEDQYQKLDKKTKLKIDYFKKFLKTDVVHLRYVSRSTANDGNHKFYREILSA